MIGASTLVQELDLKRETGPVRAVLALVSWPKGGLDEAASGLLHPRELAHARELAFERRRISYLLGRVAAKLALRRWLGQSDPRGLLIQPGVFGQPVVEGPMAERVQVGISHSGDWAGAVAFPESHPMGIDLERIAAASTQTILSQCTPGELSMVEGLPVDEDEACATLWCMKESLSKVLRSGLTSPMETYELGSLGVEDDYRVGLFCRFPQYRTVGFRFRDICCAVTLPRKTQWRTPAGALRP